MVGLICEACINAGYLTDDQRIFLLKAHMRRNIEDDRRMSEEIMFALSLQPLPYQLCLSDLLKHEPLTEEYLLYLLINDSESPDDCFIHNFQIVLNDRNLNETVKIWYYFCLPAIGSRRNISERLKKTTSIILNSEAIAKENRVKIFELLPEPDLFRQIRNKFTEFANAGDYANDPHFSLFIEDLFRFIGEMPEDLQVNFFHKILNTYDFDFNCVRRHVCTWYISQLAWLEEKKEAIVQLLEDMVSVKTGGDKYMKLSAYDALYAMSEALGTDFARQLLERGTISNPGDIRAHCYKYLLLLFDDAAYVEACLNDTSKKVRETVVRAALSGTEMNCSTRLRLSEIIKAKKLELTKKQKGRLKKLLEQ